MSTNNVTVGTIDTVNDPTEVSTAGPVQACSTVSDIKVEGSKQEYSIVGDGLYASLSADEAPAWLTGIIDNTVADSVASGMQDYDTLVQDVRSAVDSIDVAKNTFTTTVDVTNIADAVATSKVDTLNSTYEGQFATITDITSTLASDTQSLALSISNLSSEFDGTKSDITNLQTTVANSNFASASAITALESVYSDQEQAISTLSTETYASVEGVRSQFTYDALVQWGGNYYSAGFGLKAVAGGSGTAIDPFNSEFWINAERFKFTNTNQTGQVSPFTIDASGTNPNITFNGAVTFNAVDNAISGTYATVEYVDTTGKPEPTITAIFPPSVVNTQSAGTIWRHDKGVYNGVNLYDHYISEGDGVWTPLGGTYINGSNIVTGTIDAATVTVANLNADNIVTGTFSADRISGGTIDSISLTGNSISGGTIVGTSIEGGTITSGPATMSNGNFVGLGFNGVRFKVGTFRTDAADMKVRVYFNVQGTDVYNDNGIDYTAVNYNTEGLVWANSSIGIPVVNYGDFVRAKNYNQCQSTTPFSVLLGASVAHMGPSTGIRDANNVMVEANDHFIFDRDDQYDGVEYFSYIAWGF